MNNYVSPVIFDNDELAEGVYASGSGAGDCWSMTYSISDRVTKDKNPSDNYAIYRIQATHSTGLMHISASTTMFLTFHGNGIKGIQVEGVDAVVGGGTASGGYDPNVGFEVTCTSSGAIIKRTMLADAYGSGDNFNIMVRINDEDGLSVVDGLTWTCEKVENVQGTAAGELGQ